MLKHSELNIKTYVMLAFADYFLHEPVSLIRWAGTILISAGVILVFRSGQRRSDHNLKIKRYRELRTHEDADNYCNNGAR